MKSFVIVQLLSHVRFFYDLLWTVALSGSSTISQDEISAHCYMYVAFRSFVPQHFFPFLIGTVSKTSERISCLMFMFSEGGCQPTSILAWETARDRGACLYSGNLIQKLSCLPQILFRRRWVEINQQVNINRHEQSWIKMTFFGP